METKTIKQKVKFKSTPHEVYEALMDSKKHSQFSGDKAEISRKIGGKFTAYGGYIVGTNLELVPDKKIVQLWRGSDWPEGHFSKVIFVFEDKGTKLASANFNQKRTQMTFTQEGVPKDYHKPISDGWKEHYWEPMKEMLEKKK
jgi:activator of HSP90 ATPase